MLSLEVSSNESTDSILKLSFDSEAEAELEWLISEDADLPKPPPVNTDVGQVDPAGTTLSLYK